MQSIRYLKTAPVRLGDRVTVGVSSIVSIGVEVGSDCQIGALSFVPKFSRLEANESYAGIPVRVLERVKPPHEPLTD